MKRTRFTVGFKRLAGGHAWAALVANGIMQAALAQQLPPAAADPGRLRERFDFQPGAGRPLEQSETRKPQQEVLPDSMKSIRVTLKAIRIEGATALTPDALQVKVNSWIGREISGADILALAASLTAMYRNAGYILSVVVVPPQTLDDGTLTLRVIEGYIDRVNIQADATVSAAVQARLAEAGERIRASRPVDAAVLERYLLIANEFPGMTLRSVLAPSQSPGAADLTLIATIKTVEGFVSLDNYGSRYLGPGQATLAVTGNQLLGINDQWRFVGVSTGSPEMAYGQLSYSQVVSTEGLRLSAALSKARTQPGDVLKPFDVRGSADSVSLGLSYPLIKTRNQGLTARALYDHVDVHTDVLGARVVEDRIRALRIGLSWRALDRFDGQNALDVDFSQGLGGTQDSDLLKSRAGAKGVFNKLAFDYERSQPVASNMGVTLGVGGQWANTPLLSSEQYALGGRRFGRAYEPAELTGERALAFRVEPRYLGALETPGFRSYQLFGFYDIGKVWRLGTPTPGIPASQSLASAGLGVRLYLEKNVFAVVEAAWPLTKPVASYQGNGKDVRVLGSVVLRF
ncbi:MAG: ShlB/FhaC/HecB family hemolysin secretion/activation protein [Polaromonas sp.]